MNTPVSSGTEKSLCTVLSLPVFYFGGCMHGLLVDILIGTPPSLKSRAQPANGISENIIAAIPARFKKVTVRRVVKSKKFSLKTLYSLFHTFLKQSFMQVSQSLNSFRHTCSILQTAQLLQALRSNLFKLQENYPSEVTLPFITLSMFLSPVVSLVRQYCSSERNS